jgi:hypothetical protein
MWPWNKKHTTRRRRKEKKELSWEELGANDARRFVLGTSQKDAEFRKSFISSLVGTQEPSELQRRRQGSMVQEEKLEERLNRKGPSAEMAVLDQIMASDESLDRFAEIELREYHKRSGKAGPEQENVGGKLPAERDLAETGEPGGDTREKRERHGFDLAALLQNPLVKDILSIVAVALMVRVLRFIGKRVALANKQGMTEATEKLYVVLVDGKLSSVTETQYKEWEAQGRLILTTAPQPPAAPASETGT